MLRTNTKATYLTLLLLLGSVHVSVAGQSPAGRPAGNHILANDRFEVVAPGTPLRLEEGNEVRVRIKGQGLTKLFAMQGVLQAGQSRTARIEDGDQELTVQRRDNGDQFITLIPKRVGQVEFQIVGFFADGPWINQRVSFYVQPSTQSPTSFSVDTRPDILTLGQKMVLLPSAIYAGSDKPLPIDPKFVNFRVRSERGKEIVRLDAVNGSLVGVAEGHAVIEAAYGGLLWLTCVRVVDGGKAHLTNKSQCEELLNSGERTQWMRAPKP